VEFVLSLVKAFVVGGAFCVVGQILIDNTALTPARILVGYVVSGVFLTAIGLYEPLIKFAEAGASVPLTGFGYSLAKGVQKAVEQYGFMGALSGGLTATAAGIATAVCAAIIMALIFKPGDKA
jgi:stage V sporulation protein AE